MKINKILTLSTYSYGKHNISGRMKKTDIENKRVSFAESFTPILDMLLKFEDFPLGSKVKVTLEIDDSYK